VLPSAGGTASAGISDDQEPHDAPPTEDATAIPGAKTAAYAEIAGTTGKAGAAGSASQQAPNDTPQTAAKFDQGVDHPPGDDEAGKDKGSKDLPTSDPNWVDDDTKKATAKSDAGAETGTGPLPIEAPPPPGKAARDGDPASTEEKAPAPEGSTTKDTSPQGADAAPIVSKINKVIVANGKASSLAPESEEMKALNKGDARIGHKIDDVFALSGAKHLTGKNFHSPHEEQTPDGAGSAFGPGSIYFARRRRTTNPSVIEPKQYNGVDGVAGGSGAPNPNGNVHHIPGNGLPADANIWRMYTTPDGKHFYRHEATGDVQWHKPDGKIEAAAPLPSSTGSAAEGGAADGSGMGTQGGGSGRGAAGAKGAKGAGSAKFVRPAGEKYEPGAKGSAVMPEVTAIIAQYPYAGENKAKACCNGEDFDYLDMGYEKPEGVEEVSMLECEQRCRETSGCKFFETDPKAISSVCVGFKTCDQQCEVDWDRTEQAIYKLGKSPPAPAGGTPTPVATYKKHAGKTCSGSSDDPSGGKDLAATDPEECKKQCNDLDDCAGFVLATTGPLKNKCVLLGGKLAVSDISVEDKFTGDERDCFEKIPPQLPWKYDRVEGQCKGSLGDLIRDILASKDEEPKDCEKKCSEIGTDCTGFVHILSGEGEGTCHLRKGPMVMGGTVSDERNCYKKVPNENPGGKAGGSGLAKIPPPIVVKGALGGHNGDQMGVKSNGVYSFAGKHNGKSLYKLEGCDTCEIRFEEFAKGDWGAVNLGQNRNIWALIATGHHRFFIASDADTPPQSGWTARSGTASGQLDIQVQVVGGSGGGSGAGSSGSGGGSGAGSAAKPDQYVAPVKVQPVVVSGAEGTCASQANGDYEAVDTSLDSGRPVYKNSNGFQIKFESRASNPKPYAAEHLGKDSNVWVIIGTSTGSASSIPPYVYFVTSTDEDDVPPASGWRSANDECASGIIKVGAGDPNKEPDAPSEINVSGGSGGFIPTGGESDEGGQKVNGMYTLDGEYNAKAKYKNENGCVMRFDTVKAGDWAALNLGEKKDTWVVKCVGHDRYFKKDESNFPPESGWEARDGTASGTIKALSGLKAVKKVTLFGFKSKVAGDNAGADKCNGEYAPDAHFNGKTSYKNAAGCTLQYEEGPRGDWGAENLGGGKNGWAIGFEKLYRAFALSEDDEPPATGWQVASNNAAGTPALCEGSGCTVSDDEEENTAIIQPAPGPPTAAPTELKAFDLFKKSSKNGYYHIAGAAWAPDACHGKEEVVNYEQCARKCENAKTNKQSCESWEIYNPDGKGKGTCYTFLLPRPQNCVWTDNNLCKFYERKPTNTLRTKFAVLAASLRQDGSTKPGWQEVAEVKLYNAAGENVAPSASKVELDAGCGTSTQPSLITDGKWYGTGGGMAVWTGFNKFDSKRLVTFEFSTPQNIVSAEIHTTNDESMGANPKIQTSNGTTWKDLLTTTKGQGLTVIYDASGGAKFPAGGNTAVVDVAPTAS